jgi:hypothetical protein
MLKHLRVTPLFGLILFFAPSATLFAQSTPVPDYVGSAACRTCHPAIYARWSKTRMANVVLDPKVHPEAIIPDLSKPDPLVKFTKDDIAFVYGNKWKQRYFTKKGDDYYPLGAQWDVTLTRSGAPIRRLPERIGGQLTIQTTICSVLPVRCATVATR